MIEAWKTQLNRALADALQHRLWVFDSIDSTNAYIAKQLAPALCVAWHQTHGRGQGGKTWQSTEQSIAFSLAWPFRNYLAMRGLSLVAGLAVADSLRAYRPQLKWPNDIVLDGKKVAGILVETQQKLGATPVVVTGIGINISGCAEVDYKALPSTSLWREQPELNIDKRQLVASLANNLYARYLRLQAEGFAPMRLEWLESACWLGCEVDVGGTRGRYLDVDASGRIRLDTATGCMTLTSGSLRLVEKP